MARDVVPMPIPFPLVPGHEIAGVVSKVRIDSMYITGYKNGYACFMVASVANLLSDCRQSRLNFCHFFKVGKNVKDIKVGDHAGVGCFVDSCFECRWVGSRRCGFTSFF